MDSENLLVDFECFIDNRIEHALLNNHFKNIADVQKAEKTYLKTLEAINKAVPEESNNILKQFLLANEEFNYWNYKALYLQGVQDIQKLLNLKTERA